jgi:electron transport complex protein RnfD
MRSKTVTRTVMQDVLIALTPAFVMSIVIFGFRALIVEAVCVATAVLSEYFYRKLMRLSNTVTDLSAAVTGLLLAFNLPVGIPLWMAMIGSFVAVVIVKQLFGGIGKNFANPAIVGRIVLLISFATPMTTWALPNAVDAVTGATPLAGGAVGSYMELFLGNIGGSLGETCKLALLLGGVYLVARKIITPTIPLAFMGTVVVLSAVLWQDPLFHLLTGGVMLGAIFMATDYVTSPTTEFGKLIFGIGCGLITIVIRLYAGYPEGVSFAILLMNIVAPLIDRYTPIKAFGAAKKGGAVK